jgi:hypothetical protein
MFGWYLAVTPFDELLFVNFSDSFFKIQFTELPYDAQCQWNFAINNIDASDTNDFQA